MIDRVALHGQFQPIALVLPGSVGASISASNIERMRSSASSSESLVSLAKMRAACRATSAMSMPQACGSSKARRSETCSPPSTMAARRTSTPPCSSAVGGTWSASNVAINSSPSFDGRDRTRDVGRVFHLALERGANACQRLRLREAILLRVGARHLARHLGKYSAPVLRLVEDRSQRQVEFALHDSAAQEFKASALVRSRRDIQRLIWIAHDTSP